MAGTADSSEAAAVALQVVGEMTIGSRTVSKLAAQIGGQLAQQRDERTKQYVERPVPWAHTSVSPPPALAAVFCDGGRMRTRSEGRGTGVHEPHWRETKNASFHRMESRSSEVDPQAELPECFRNQSYVEKLVLGLKKAKTPQPEPPLGQAEPGLPNIEEPADAPPAWQPKTLFRTCLSSLATSDEFGPMMATEADARGFFTATKRAFVGDGQAYNWTLQRHWFPDFTAIVDFVHVVEYLYEAAKALHATVAPRWQQFVAWASACWKGQTEHILLELSGRIAELEGAVEATPQADTRATLESTRTYLLRNRSRMNYPEYRRQGMPVTSSLAESLVKQISKRVKGTEKFWNDGASGEAILQIRADVISDNDRLGDWLRTRPVSPYAPRCRAAPLAIAA